MWRTPHSSKISGFAIRWAGQRCRWATHISTGQQHITLPDHRHCQGACPATMGMHTKAQMCPSSLSPFFLPAHLDTTSASHCALGLMPGSRTTAPRSRAMGAGENWSRRHCGHKCGGGAKGLGCRKVVQGVQEGVEGTEAAPWLLGKNWPRRHCGP